MGEMRTGERGEEGKGREYERREEEETPKVGSHPEILKIP